ncbi:putative RNA-directed DNA polymerase from transposon X-element [Trichonephila clavipes]|nr:putative RNA-directed DNA polymerase from transposon X-element [Trichonephila clavipes]
MGPLDIFAQDNSLINKPFHMSELNRAIKSAKNTTPGADQILAKFLKLLNHSERTIILNFFQQIFDKTIVPKEWKHAIILPIPKPCKHKTKISSYRPIALISVFSETFERILANRIAYFLVTEYAERNENYTKDDAIGGFHVIYMVYVLLDRYAKTRNGEDIYPIQVTNQTPRRYKEVMLNEKSQWKKLISDQLLLKVQANNIISKLYRENKTYRDYVTNIKPIRLSRAARKVYTTLALSNFVYGVNANNPPQNNPLNPPQIPLNKQLPKISHKLNWSLIGIDIFVLLAVVCFLYKYLFTATK